MTSTHNHAATRVRGRPPGCNLHRDGYETAAEWIKGRLIATKGVQVVDVDDNFSIRLTARGRLAGCEFEPRLQSPQFVGIYSPAAEVEHIEDDLLHWLRGAR